MIVFLSVAGVIYSARNGFSLLVTQISTLGSHVENPPGWSWFSVALWVLAAGSLPILALFSSIIAMFVFVSEPLPQLSKKIAPDSYNRIA